MPNTAKIDVNQYYTESKKAIEIALENERLEQRKLKAKEMLEFVKKQKEDVRSVEEYDELEKRERELEKKIKFNLYHIPAVPEEHKEKIKKNATIEHLAATERLNELKTHLKGHIEKLEQELAPLLEEMAHLEKMKKIPEQIDLILDSDIGEGAVISIGHRLQPYRRHLDETPSGKSLVNLRSFIASLKKIEVPTETKSLLNFLKRGKK